MDEKQGGTSSDSDFGDSWTIVDKNSFCNRMMDAISAFDCDKVFEEYELSNVRDCALCFQDDSNNDADADSDGISVISENEEQLMANPASTYVATSSKTPTPPSSPEPKTSQDTQPNSWTTQPETRTPKKNKTKFNKPLTPPNTPVDCDSPVLDKTEKKHKKRSYVHNRNEKVSNILNILVAGTIATAAGLAFGHLMGSKSDCANLAGGMNNELSFKQLQYENQKLKNELQDLKRESWHFTNRFNKHAAKGRRNFTENTIPTHVAENNPKFDSSKKHQLRDQNNNLKVPETSSKPVFFGPKTYADTISSNIKKFVGIGETQDNISAKQLISDIKNFDKKKCNSITNADVHKTGLTCSQELSSQEQSKTVRNHSFPNLLDSDVKSDVQESNKTMKASERQAMNTNSENLKKSKQKNSKTKPTSVSVLEESAQDNDTEDIKSNVKASTVQNANGKLKRKSNQKDRSMSKKPRSISSGKESGDFGNSAISLDKLGESITNQKTEKPHPAGEEIEQQYGNKGSQKYNKQDHKPKDKAKERKISSEYDSKVEKNNKKNKFNKNQKFSEEDLMQNVNKNEEKRNRRDKKQSKINFQKSDILSSQDDIKLNKDKRNSEKFTKSHQKDDRRKSDFRHEKKDKYEEWEMNKGYEYYLSNDIFPDDMSDDESSTSKVHKHTSEKTVYSSDEPAYSKKTKKVQKKTNFNMLNDMEHQNENWVYDPTEKSSSTNSNNDNVDGSWVDDIAKYREEQRNKQQESDWVFERAKVRDMKRDKASWYFNRMNEREQCRTKERSKRNNATKPRSNKKSPNYRSKL